MDGASLARSSTHGDGHNLPVRKEFHEIGKCFLVLVRQLDLCRTESLGVEVGSGDINIHHKGHSYKNIEIGRRLLEICSDVELKQIVTRPTRVEYIFDVIFTDAPELCKVEVA